MLKITASTYDPVGYFTPVTLKAKLLLQTLWHEVEDWHEDISDSIKELWMLIAKELKELSTIRLNLKLLHPLETAIPAIDIDQAPVNTV